MKNFNTRTDKLKDEISKFISKLPKKYSYINLLILRKELDKGKKLYIKIQ